MTNARWSPSAAPCLDETGQLDQRRLRLGREARPGNRADRFVDETLDRVLDLGPIAGREQQRGLALARVIAHRLARLCGISAGAQEVICQLKCDPERDAVWAQPGRHLVEPPREAGAQVERPLDRGARSAE